MRWLLSALLCAAACGDAGPRDRSLSVVPGSDGRPTRRRSTRAASVIGLVGDRLAPLYADDAIAVLRFAELSKLDPIAAEQLDEIVRVLPGLGIPAGKPGALLRKLLGLRRTDSLDRMRPFALVKTPKGWAGVVPTRSEDGEDSERLRALDGIYSVAGEPDVVAAYNPSWHSGFYLPGDCSLVTQPASLHEVGLGALARALPEDITRVDMSLRFEPKGLRVDLRLAPDGTGETAVHLERLKPSLSKAMPFLPSGGTAYAELRAPAQQWEKLFLRFVGGLPEADAEVMDAARDALAVLDQDTAVMLDLGPDGAGRLTLVAHLEDESYAEAFIGSVAFRRLLNHIAGPGGNLEWKPDIMSRRWVTVGAVTGNLSRRRLKEWRKGGAIAVTAAELLRGPVLAYVGVVDRKLCVLIGQRTRVDVERTFERLRMGKLGDNDHESEVDSLFKVRLASASVDLAKLFGGLRHTGAAWHKDGRRLSDLSMPWRIPAAAAVSIEGGALRIALRVRPGLLAEAAAKIRDTLDAHD